MNNQKNTRVYIQSFKILRNFLIFSGLLLFLFTNSSYAGYFLISPTSYLDKGITLSPSVSAGTSIGTDTSNDKYFFTTVNNTITISGLSVKKGNSWDSITFNVSSGKITISITDSAGNRLLNDTTIQTNTTISLAGTEAAKESRSLTITLKWVDATARLYSMSLSYKGAGAFAYPSPYIISKGRLSISYDVANDASVTLEIYDARGRLVKRIYRNQFLTFRTSPKQSDSWDGRSDNGDKVSTGVYYIRLQVKYLNTTKYVDSSYNSTFRFLVLR